KGPIKHMDTQSTMPWATESQDSPGVPNLVLADLLELQKDELGRALFFDSLRLGPGASSFREFVLNGLCFLDGETMMKDDGASEANERLKHVHRVTAQLIKDAQEKARVCNHFIAEGYEKVLTSAQMSVAKVKAKADQDSDKGKALLQKQKADMWLSKEVAALDKRKTDLSLAATKAASFAAGKVHALIGHLRFTGLLSDHFTEQMEIWSQLDSTDAAARSVRKALPEKKVAPVVLFEVLVPKSRFLIQPQITCFEVLVPKSRIQIQPQITCFEVL
ncbi:F5, partial [Symbiodinium necroappetens]